MTSYKVVFTVVSDRTEPNYKFPVTFCSFQGFKLALDLQIFMINIYPELDGCVIK